MRHKIEIAPNLAIAIDGERVIGSKPHGLFLTTEMIVSDEDLKRLADRCLEVISDSKTEDCDYCKMTHKYWYEHCDTCKYKPKTEPQTDYGDFADRLAYERGVKHAWEVAQKVFDSTVTFYEAEDVAKWIAKDEPLTCDGNCWMKKQNGEWLCEHCQRKPQTERSE